MDDIDVYMWSFPEVYLPPSKWENREMVYTDGTFHTGGEIPSPVVSFTFFSNSMWWGEKKGLGGSGWFLHCSQFEMSCYVVREKTKKQLCIEGDEGRSRQAKNNAEGRTLTIPENSTVLIVPCCFLKHYFVPLVHVNLASPILGSCEERPREKKVNQMDSFVKRGDGCKRAYSLIGDFLAQIGNCVGLDWRLEKARKVFDSLLQIANNAKRKKSISEKGCVAGGCRS